MSWKSPGTESLQWKGEYPGCVSRPRGSRGICCAIWISLWAGAVDAAVDLPAGEPLTLAEAESLALTEEPGQIALLARAQALESHAVAAGELPDPTLRLGIANYPIESGSFSTEPMTQAQLGLRQAFPAGRTRAESTRQYLLQAQELQESAESRSLDVLMAVRQGWLDVYFQEHARAVVAESRPLFADLVSVTRSLYAVGRKDQQDVLRAELELSRLDDRLIDIDRKQARARAELGQWLGHAAKRPLAPELPAWDAPPPFEELRSRLVDHPALAAAAARIAARDAGIDLARQRYRPGWALDVGYGYREGDMADGDPRSDFVSVAVSFELPLFPKNRQDRTVAAAVSERAAATAAKDELLRRMLSQLEGEYARWQDLTRQADLYRNRILTLAEDQSRAALLAYQSETGDFADVMQGSIDLLDVRIDTLRLTIERARSHAVLANLGGLL